MGNRSIMCGAATVEIDLTRYDELLHKEEKLRIMEEFVGKNFFKDVKTQTFSKDDLILVEDAKCETDLQNCT